MKKPNDTGTRKQARALDAGVPVKRGEAPADNGKQADKAPTTEFLGVPVALLLAAESVVAQVAKTASAVQRAILIHQRDNGAARVVGYQAGVGGRLFVGSFPVTGKAPAWLRPGLLIARDQLKARLNMIAKLGESDFVMVSYKKGDPYARLSDQPKDDDGTPSMAFQVQAAQRVEEVAVYEQNFKAASFVNLDEEGTAKAHKDWEPVGFNSRHMKHCAEIAKLLEGSLPKEQRSENGLVIRSYSSGETNAPRVFVFEGVDGAVLLLAGTEIVQSAVPLQTARILAPATKLTLAALRAHATRWRQAADSTTNEKLKAEYLAKEKGFLDRVADILARVPEVKGQIEAPKAARQIAQQQPEDDDDGIEEDEELPVGNTVH